MDAREIGEIKSLLSKKKEIVIIPHKNPDGDAIGASTGLKNYLDNYIILRCLVFCKIIITN